VLALSLLLSPCLRSLSLSRSLARSLEYICASLSTSLTWTRPFRVCKPMFGMDHKKPPLPLPPAVLVDFVSGARAVLELCMFAEASKHQEEVTLVGTRGKLEAFAPTHGAKSDNLCVPCLLPSPVQRARSLSSRHNRTHSWESSRDSSRHGFAGRPPTLTQTLALAPSLRGATALPIHSLLALSPPPAYRAGSRSTFVATCAPRTSSLPTTSGRTRRARLSVAPTSRRTCRSTRG